MAKGYYALIQFCPDFARAEVANVGVLVLRLHPPATEVRIVEDVRDVRKRLGPKRVGLRSLREAVQGVEFRLRRLKVGSLEELEQFVRARGNEIQLTMPRPMRVEDPAADASRLFEELVVPDRPTAAEQVEEPAVRLLERAFDRLHEQAPDRVSLAPVYTARDLEPVRVDFAYRNGSLNLVQTIVLPREVDRARTEAYALHTLGEIVRTRLETPDKVETQNLASLTVVARPDHGHAGRQEPLFERILASLRLVRFVRSDEIADFVAEVEQDVLGHGG